MVLEGSCIYFERKGAFSRPLSHTLASLAKKIRSRLIVPGMNIGKLKVKKKLDWIRLAFILEELGDLDLEILTFAFNEMFRNTKTRREVSGIIVSYEKKGFDFPSRSEPNKKYSFHALS